MTTPKKTQASSADLQGRADELQEERDSIESRVDGLESDLADALFAGESDKATAIKKRIAEAVARIADIDHAVKGSKKAIAAATAVEAEAHRKRQVTAYNKALSDGQEAIAQFLEVADNLPAPAQAAIGNFATASRIWSELFPGGEGASVKCPAQPGQWIHDVATHCLPSVYGLTAGASHNAKARRKLAEMSDGHFLPDEDAE